MYIVKTYNIAFKARAPIWEYIHSHLTGVFYIILNHFLAFQYYSSLSMMNSLALHYIALHKPHTALICIKSPLRAKQESEQKFAFSCSQTDHYDVHITTKIVILNYYWLYTVICS